MKPSIDYTDSNAVLESLKTDNHFDVTKIDASNVTVYNMGRKSDAIIHATAVACIYLSMPHVDGGHNCHIRAMNLVNNMPKGSRVKALVAWFAAYSNVRLIFDKKVGKYRGGVLKPDLKGYDVATPQAALAKPFWMVEEANVSPKAFTDDTLAIAVANLIARAKMDNAVLSVKGLAALKDLQTISAANPPVKKAVTA
jgi:hypothetical protein